MNDVTDEMVEATKKAIDDYWWSRCGEYLSTKTLEGLTRAALAAALARKSADGKLAGPIAIEQSVLDRDARLDDAVLARKPVGEWRPIETAPLGEDDFYLVCGVGDERSPFVVRGAIFRSARMHAPSSHLSLQWLTHWMPLPAKPDNITVTPEQTGIAETYREP